MTEIRQAIILAAGEGQRLKPFTALMPKVMLPLAGKPILEYVVDALIENGIRRLVIVIGYKKEQVQDYFASGHNHGIDIEYVVQEQQLGTAHALRKVRDLADETFLVLGGDNIIEADTITPLVESPSPTILVKTALDVSRYGVVMVRDGKVIDILEKPKMMISNLVNTGIYVFDRTIFDYADDELDLPYAIRNMLSQGYAMSARETSGIWLDAVYPWDMLSINSLILRNLTSEGTDGVEAGATLIGPVVVGEKTIIRSNSYIVGPVKIGDGCEIGPSACILPSTSIASNVVISPFSLIENSIIGASVKIGPGSSLQNSIVAAGSTIKGHLVSHSGKAIVPVEEEYHQVEIGAMMGSYCEIGESTLLEPGVIIGNCTHIKGMKTVRGNLPDNSIVM